MCSPAGLSQLASPLPLSLLRLLSILVKDQGLEGVDQD